MRSLDILVGYSWIAFWLYWIFRGGSSKPNIEHGRLARSLRLVMFMPMYILIFLTLHGHSNLGYNISRNHLWLKILGLALFYGGLALAIWARKYLGTNWGLPMSIKKNPQLIIGGPYSLIRHPIYTGIILAPLGTFIVLGVAWLFPLIIGSSYFIFSALQEDKQMARQFPKTYPAYKARTKLLIPYIF